MFFYLGVPPQVWVAGERIRQESLPKSYEAVGTTARIVADDISLYLLLGATAATVSWLVQWAWIAIRRSAISGFRPACAAHGRDRGRQAGIRFSPASLTNSKAFVCVPEGLHLSAISSFYQSWHQHRGIPLHSWAESKPGISARKIEGLTPSEKGL